MGLAKGGFSGLGLISIPLLCLVMPPVQAAAVMLPILIVQDAVSVWAYRKSFDRRNLMLLLPGSVVGIGLGWYFAARLSDAMVLLVVGLVAVGFVLINWRRKAVLQAAAQLKPSAPLGFFWGSVAGLTSFVAHAGGPPFQVYVLPQRLPPQRYAGTNTMFFAVTNLVKVGPYAALGQFSSGNMAVSGALFPIAIAATFAGVWLVRRIDASRFYTIVYALTFTVGLKLIWDGAFRLAGELALLQVPV
jgi:uncharacterized membrane protein YfcA